MKRSADEALQGGINSRIRDLSFLGKSLTTVRNLSLPATWREAKLAAQQGRVHLTSLTTGDSNQQHIHIHGRVDQTDSNGKFVSFCHGRKPAQGYAALLQVDSATGELLDSDTSCCPGGYNPVHASFCPCVTAVLLAACKDQQASSCKPTPLEKNIWLGTTACTAVAQRSFKHETLHLQQQPGCLTGPLQLGEWEHSGKMGARMKLTNARAKQSYDRYGHYPRLAAGAFSEDVLSYIDDAETEQLDHHWFRNAHIYNLNIPNNPLLDPAVLARLSGGAPVALPEDAALKDKLVWQMAGGGLTYYNGRTVTGWKTRPKVINEAYDKLTTTYSGSAGTLTAVTLLARALWEYFYVTGLSTNLAKPMKILLAIRNLLLVTDLPLWVRKGLAAQVQRWEKELLNGHAAEALAISGQVGLVHLMKVFKEIITLCLNGWDHPQLVSMLQGEGAADTAGGAAATGEEYDTPMTDAFATSYPPPAGGAGGGGSSDYGATGSSDAAVAGGVAAAQEAGGAESREGVAGGVVTREMTSVVQLRLLYLEALGCEDVYLALAMGAKMWSEAVSSLLKSGDRAKLQRAVKLLPQHITRLPERLKYMTTLVELGQLGAAERLEVAARLLVDMRGELKLQQGVHLTLEGAGTRAWWGHALWRYKGPAGLDESDELVKQLREFLAAFNKVAGEALFAHATEAKVAMEAALKDAGDAAGNEGGSGDGSSGRASSPTAAAAGGGAAGVTQGIGGQMPVEDYMREAAAAARATNDLVLRLEHMQSALLRNGRERLPDVLKPCVGLLETVRTIVLSQSLYQYQYQDAWDILRAIEAGTMVVGAVSGGVSDTFRKLIRVALQPRTDREVSVEGPTSPPPAAPPVKLLAVDEKVFSGGVESAAAYQNSGGTYGPSLRSRPMGKGGYVDDADVKKAYAQVYPADYPDLVSMCGLAVKALHEWIAEVMSYCSVAGLDPCLPLDPLLEVASHPLVEYGCPAVRIQAALELVVYFLAMTPLTKSYAGVGQDKLYRSVTWQLLGIGQRHLALMMAKARYRTMPSRETAGELLEVAISCGPEAQAEAVDWVLGKGPLADGAPAAAAAAEEGAAAAAEGGSNGGGSGVEGLGVGGDGRAAEEGSVDTMELIGSEAARRIALADTGSSKRRKLNSFLAAGQAGGGAAAGGGGGAGAAARGAGAGVAAGGDAGDVVVIDDDDDEGQLEGPELQKRVEALFQQMEKFVEEVDLRGEEMDMVETAERERVAAELSRLTGVSEGALQQRLKSFVVTIAEAIFDEEEYGPDSYHTSEDDEEDLLAMMEGNWGGASRRRREVLRQGAVSQVLLDGREARAGSQPPHQHSQVASGGVPVGPGAKGGTGGDAEEGEQAALVADLLGLSTHEWRQRCEGLAAMGLWEVAQYARGKGLAEELVQRLALVAWAGDKSCSTTAAAADWKGWRTTMSEWVESRFREYHGERWPSGMEPRVAEGTKPSNSHANIWKGMPTPNWASFRAQDQSCYQAIRDTGLSLAWLLADVMGPGPSKGFASKLPLLKQLALMSRGCRYGFPLLQLAHAIMLAGDRTLACEVAAAGLPPRAASFQQLDSITAGQVDCLKELLPMLYRHGNEATVEAAAVSELFVLRRPLSPSQLLDKSLMLTLMGHWRSLVMAYNNHDDDKLKEKMLSIMDGSIALVPAWQQTYGYRAESPWRFFNYSLSHCVFSPLVDALPEPQRNPNTAGSSSSSGSSYQAATVDSRGLSSRGKVEALGGLSSVADDTVVTLLGDVVLRGTFDRGPAYMHWSMQLYIVRVARHVGLVRTWSGLSALLQGPLAAAVAHHNKELPADLKPPSDMQQWRRQKQEQGNGHRHGGVADLMRRGAAAQLAKGWVHGVLAWVGSEIAAAAAKQDRGPLPSTSTLAATTAAAAAAPLEQSKIWFLSGLCSALLPWTGPELLPLLRTIRTHLPGAWGSCPSLVTLLRNAVLPLVGRHDVLQEHAAWKGSSYKDALKGLLGDEGLLKMLPRDLVQLMALTYWYKDETAEAMLQMSSLLLALESGQPLRTALGPLDVGGGAQPQLHPMLQQYLDLLPSKGLQAATLRFTQVQTCAARNDLVGAVTAILGSGFSSQDVAGPSAAAAAAGGGTGAAAAARPSAEAEESLAKDMEMVEMVMGFVEGQPQELRSVLSFPPYLALKTLKLDVGWGDAAESYLGQLSPPQQLLALRLKIWTTAKAIVKGVPDVQLRTELGPKFPMVSDPSGMLDYSLSQERWSRQEVGVLQQQLEAMARAGVAAAGGTPAAVAAQLVAWMNTQELGLAWAINRYAGMVTSHNAVHQDLKSLLPAAIRDQLGRLPVFCSALGAAVKADRTRLAAAYLSFRAPDVPPPLQKYVFKHNKDAFLKHLGSKYTIPQLQELKGRLLPWVDWVTGHKALQAQELGDWLWWLLKEGPEGGLTGLEGAVDPLARFAGSRRRAGFYAVGFI